MSERVRKQSIDRATEREIVRAKLAPQKDELLRRRTELVKKQELGDGLSTTETRRLAYIRWQLDQLDDAMHGDGLDELERMVAAL